MNQNTITEETQGRRQKRTALWIALAIVLVLLAILIVPPLLSVSRYRSRITQLISSSLGRPVRLSSVEVRLLPMPGFVLTDLTVEEDQAYGAEPVLHANTVTASIRLLSLWRGRLEISRVSVDEASVNLVRLASGRWNLDPLFKTAVAQAHPGPGNATVGKPLPLPYLEATNSRINLMKGTEKLPFSLLNTDLSLWQPEPGEWRIRLRGQPARTDVSLDLADTGVVRLEGNIRPASQLREMPMHLELEWREAQLGQLARLIIGSDPGWRGALSGNLRLDGTADAAQVQARLRAEGVHREEFAPATTLDFDAQCGLVYHYTSRAIENLSCDSPLGNGRIHLAGELPTEPGPPRFSVELFRIPVTAFLDALRTVRSGIGSGLEARGTVSGKISYAPSAPETGRTPKPAGQTRVAAKLRPVVQGPLTGSVSVDGFQLSGNGLGTPIQASKVLFEPVTAQSGQQDRVLGAAVAIPSGAGSLTVTARVALSGYKVGVRGQASVARAKELAHAIGLPDTAGLDALAGDPITVDLNAEGPWQPKELEPFSNSTLAGVSAGPALQDAAVRDRLSGTVILRNANWKADYLANHVEISQATLHLGSEEIRWAPVLFSFGPVKGTAALSLPAECASPQPCPASFQVEFGELDAAALQAAILGAHEPGTLLSTLISRLRPSSPPAWPQLDGTVKADSLLLRPATLHGVRAMLHILPGGVEISGLDAGLLGGRVHGTGTFHTPATDRVKPVYALSGEFQKLSPQAVGQLLGLSMSGGAIDGQGKIDLAGFTDQDLAASSKGSLHFEWRHGSVASNSAADLVPPALTRFDRWTADAEIADGAITLKQNQVQQGGRKRAVEASVALGDPARVAFTTPKATAVNH